MQSHTLEPLDPVKYIIDELGSLRDDVIELKILVQRNPYPQLSEYLTSIRDIADCFDISMSSAQKLKDDNPESVIQVGPRKFMINKNSLLDSLRKKKYKRRSRKHAQNNNDQTIHDAEINNQEQYENKI